MTDAEIIKELQKLWKENSDIPTEVFIRAISAIMETNALAMLDNRNKEDTQ